jgi:hypothetical protein
MAVAGCTPGRVVQSLSLDYDGPSVRGKQRPTTKLQTLRRLHRDRQFESPRVSLGAKVSAPLSMWHGNAPLLSSAAARCVGAGARADTQAGTPRTAWLTWHDGMISTRRA